MENDEYRSHTEIGKEYGVSSHQVGKWLKDMGLRTKDGKPVPRHFQVGT